MDVLTSMRVFRSVVEGGSFVGAAQRLGLSTAMASKHVARLEARLGVRLLNRTSRHLSLTEAGTVYIEHCRDTLDMFDAAETAVTHNQQVPRGVLKVTAPVWCANRRVADVLAQYRVRYPDVVLELHLENRRVDLVEEGFDLALRATREPAPSLIVRPVCSLQFLLVASPAYLKARGRPAAPQDLAAHAAILPTYVSLDALRLHGPEGSAAVPLTAAMRCSDTTLTLQCVLAGLGVAFLPEWLVAEGLKNGQLKPMLPGWRMQPLTLYAAYTSRKFMTPKVRSFIDFVSEALA